MYLLPFDTITMRNVPNVTSAIRAQKIINGKKMLLNSSLSLNIDNSMILFYTNLGKRNKPL